MTEIDIEPSWNRVLQEEFRKPYFQSLIEFLKQERRSSIPIYPPKGQVFTALSLTPFDAVKVVIVGQDPYHGQGQAHGLCFSVSKGIAPPPSLKNIFKELHRDLGIQTPSHGCLEKWAGQGVLLLNTILTVRAGAPLSHRNQGWEQFTDAIVKALAERPDPVIFVLWGKNAIDKCSQVPQLSSGKDLLLTAAHPSPFSAHRGFLGCSHFSKVNNLLKSFGKEPIDWRLE